MLKKTIRILLVVFPLLFTAGLWIYGFIQANDFSIAIKSADNFTYTNILVIFPHPDDGAQSLSGTLSLFAKNNAQINWIILTRGERGTADAHPDDNLKRIRTQESETVAKILKIDPPSFGDFPDNQLADHEDALTAYVRQQIATYKPDLIITYDESGGYGHPDHMLVSRIVTSLLKTDFPNIRLWYTSTPEKLFNQLSLPTHMATNQEFLKSRKPPTFRVWIGVAGVAAKIRTVYAYKSQFNSFMKSVPIKQIPMWFYISLTPYEYFHDVN
ncbi:MAG: PIG-L deacetylase family protein [Patescibacteria group bacterium]